MRNAKRDKEHISLGNGMSGRLIKLNKANMKRILQTTFRKATTANDLVTDDAEITYQPIDLINRRLLLLHGKISVVLVLSHIRGKKDVDEILRHGGLDRLFRYVMLFGYRQQAYFPYLEQGELLLRAIRHNVSPAVCRLVYETPESLK